MTARARMTAAMATTVLLGALVGCRTPPGLDTSTRVQVPTQPPDWQMQGTVRTAYEDWQAAGGPLGGRPDGIGVGDIEQRRWEGVVLYFAYDSSAIGEAERPKLETLSQHLKANPSYRLIIEGHCDERGSDEYNRALGQSRALAVRDYLIRLGSAAERIDTVSYGEERPVVPNATSEVEHQKNRRAEFIFGIRR